MLRIKQLYNIQVFRANSNKYFFMFDGFYLFSFFMYISIIEEGLKIIYIYIYTHKYIFIYM